MTTKTKLTLKVLLNDLVLFWLGLFAILSALTVFYFIGYGFMWFIDTPANFQVAQQSQYWILNCIFQGIFVALGLTANGTLIGLCIYSYKKTLKEQVDRELMNKAQMLQDIDKMKAYNGIILTEGNSKGGLNPCPMTLKPVRPPPPQGIRRKL